MAMGCNKRLRQKLEAILGIGSKSPALMALVAEAALTLNEQAEMLRRMERIRSKEVPTGVNGGRE